MFHQPPVLFTWGGVWTWGGVGVISVTALWAFVALFVGRQLHLQYLSLYYCSSTDVTLEVSFAWKVL